MTTLTIALLTTSFPLYAGSPSGIFVARLLKHLPNSVEINVVTPNSRKVSPAVLSGEGIKVYPFRYAPRRYEVLAHEPGGIPVALREHPSLILLVPFFLASMMLSFWRHARTADVLHANWAICGFVAGIVGYIRGVPVITTLRGEDVVRSQTSRIDCWILAAALRLSKQVVTVSYAFAQHIRDHYPQWASKVITIPNGVDRRFINAGSHRHIYRPPKVMHLICIASLIPRKGVDQLLEAVMLCRNTNRIRLELVGNGPERGRLDALVNQYHLGDRVCFHGEESEDRIPELLSEADVMVLASHSEGRPNVVLEAMAAGVAIIATDIPGLNEIIHHAETGFLFSDGDPAQLAKYIDALFEDTELLIGLGQRARRYILDNNLIWTETACAYVDVYKHLARA